LSLLLDMFFMWKLIMFSECPVKTASAALRIRNQTVTHQSAVYVCVCVCVCAHAWCVSTCASRMTAVLDKGMKEMPRLTDETNNFTHIFQLTSTSFISYSLQRTVLI
jgi:hypothetical protein